MRISSDEAEIVNEIGSDAVFAGSIPEFYDEYLVPLIFQPYAEDLARRLADLDAARVLEIAAGTGVATRAAAQAMPGSVELVATDLNQAMLDQAEAVGAVRPVRWQQADAMELPFAPADFDLVFCQFGAMFFPDKARAFAEARRVLRPGGILMFNVWDRIEENEFADIVTDTLAGVFPTDPPRFLARTPHGYCDLNAIANDLVKGGFASAPYHETVTARSRAASARVPAVAYCQGSPLRGEIEQRSGADLAEATAACTEAIARSCGPGPVDGRIQAHVVIVRNA
jgi:ubiquinone/menaquinone biosynthesis C-methylase UbiE